MLCLIKKAVKLKIKERIRSSNTSKMFKIYYFNQVTLLQRYINVLLQQNIILHKKFNPDIAKPSAALKDIFPHYVQHTNYTYF